MGGLDVQTSFNRLNDGIPVRQPGARPGLKPPRVNDATAEERIGRRLRRLGVDRSIDRVHVGGRAERRLAGWRRRRYDCAADVAPENLVQSLSALTYRLAERRSLLESDGARFLKVGVTQSRTESGGTLLPSPFLPSLHTELYSP